MFLEPAQLNFSPASLPHGFVCHQILTDHLGRPVDYVFYDVNPAFEKMMGLSRDEVVGTRVSQLPVGEDMHVDWFSLYQMALEEGSLSFEGPFMVGEDRYRVTAYGGMPGFTVALFHELEPDEGEDPILEEREAVFSKVFKHYPSLPLPGGEGLSMAVYYQPARLFGGDCFEVMKTQRFLLFYLGHISQESPDCALLFSLIKETVKRYLDRFPPDTLRPAYLLQDLAAHLSLDIGSEYDIRIFLGFLDLDSRELKYSGVGFVEAPFLSRGEGAQIQLFLPHLSRSSYSLFDSPSFPEGRMVLTPATTLFCTTQGLLEEQALGERYGERLSRLCCHYSHLPPARLAQRVIKDFQSFHDTSQPGREDITFFVLQLDPLSSASYSLELATDFQELKRLRQELWDWVPDLQGANSLIICLSELVANAMEHGNRMDPHKRVTVDIFFSQGCYHVQVEDEGEGFHWQEVRDQPLELEGETPRGRGIAMTQLFCDALSYNATGNRVTFTIETHLGGV